MHNLTKYWDWDMSDSGTWALNQGLSRREHVCTIKKIKQPQQHVVFIFPPKRDGAKWSMLREM